MKKLIKSSFFMTFCCVCAVIMSSCELPDPEQDYLMVVPGSVITNVNEQKGAIIRNGVPPYKAKVKDLDIASAEIKEDVLILTGLKRGVTIVTVTDSINSVTNMSVTVQ